MVAVHPLAPDQLIEFDEDRVVRGHVLRGRGRVVGGGEAGGRSRGLSASSGGPQRQAQLQTRRHWATVGDAAAPWACLQLSTRVPRARCPK